MEPECAMFMFMRHIRFFRQLRHGIQEPEMNRLQQKSPR
jgi:hypothetical protein